MRARRKQFIVNGVISYYCPDCKKVKPDEDFYRQSSPARLPKTACKKCDKLRSDRWRKKSENFGKPKLLYKPVMPGTPEEESFYDGLIKDMAL